MKIGIIAAMEEELTLLLDKLDNATTTYLGQFAYHTGQIGGVDVALFQCGIGKVNAAVGATLLLDKFTPDYLINTGVAGGFPAGVQIGDVVISSEVRHYDADATAFEYEIGQIPQMPAAYVADGVLSTMARKAGLSCSGISVHHGPILSGDSFVHTSRQVEYIEEHFPDVMAVEMEGAAIAQTGFLFNVPFVLIRSISDKVCETGNTATYSKCMIKAAENSIKIVLGIIDDVRSEA
ncbi:5'-methylthioadenosine/adenosylhomocysteine nucleosidase [Desulfosediminicola flagellatus]|uniref:5'-methylthioadenosine/adenosylhomocysteine nucleosidase n=1 Tax=Desulfosediminicola flagellatus TaxID=2569541 RepID=UPI0010AD1E41|nr:5'-methylthioadenosine/adenosylhomocysteine nucleosidase [Desulfosediminicola flagellatus]